MFAGLAAGCSPDVPANPTYTKDVQPIFEAHCVRCHGANDTLDTCRSTGSTTTPKFCYLQRFESEGDCTIPIGALARTALARTAMRAHDP